MSRFYGFPVFDMPRQAKLALLSAMPVLQAQDAIERNGYTAYDPNTLFELVKTATGSEAEAHEAVARRAELLRTLHQEGGNDE